MMIPTQHVSVAINDNNNTHRNVIRCRDAQEAAVGVVRIELEQQILLFQHVHGVIGDEFDVEECLLAVHNCCIESVGVVATDWYHLLVVTQDHAFSRIHLGDCCNALLRTNEVRAAGIHQRQTVGVQRLATHSDIVNGKVPVSNEGVTVTVLELTEIVPCDAAFVMLLVDTTKHDLGTGRHGTLPTELQIAVLIIHAQPTRRVFRKVASNIQVERKVRSQQNILHVAQNGRVLVRRNHRESQPHYAFLRFARLEALQVRHLREDLIRHMDAVAYVHRVLGVFSIHTLTVLVRN
mmetsp:Transcript_8610/g.24758  ORF Transcript_8610/g.24758 Transcript_8610/m.24758 type:complete len:293 (+) Transcript_8610:413-1291(+)